MLRQHGGDVYDQWVSHEIPFNDPQIVEAMQTGARPLDARRTCSPAAATSPPPTSATTPRRSFDDQCYMHRQANFFSGFFPEGTAFADGSEDAIDAFYFPDINGDRPVLTAGTLRRRVRRRRRPRWPCCAYMSTPEYANLRQATQTAELDGTDCPASSRPSRARTRRVYQPLEQGFLEILDSSELSGSTPPT